MTKEAPGTLVNQWTSTKGTKGTTVVVLVVDHWLTIASVRMLRMSFL